MRRSRNESGAAPTPGPATVSARMPKADDDAARLIRLRGLCQMFDELRVHSQRPCDENAEGRGMKDALKHKTGRRLRRV